VSGEKCLHILSVVVSLFANDADHCDQLEYRSRSCFYFINYPACHICLPRAIIKPVLRPTLSSYGPVKFGHHIYIGGPHFCSLYPLLQTVRYCSVARFMS